MKYDDTRDRAEKAAKNLFNTTPGQPYSVTEVRQVLRANVYDNKGRKFQWGELAVRRLLNDLVSDGFLKQESATMYAKVVSK